MGTNHDDVKLSELAETHRFYGDMRFKQLTLFMAAMSAAIGGVHEFPNERWWLAVAGLFFTGVMWIMEVRSTAYSIGLHSAAPELLPRQKFFWPLLNSSFAVLSLHVAFYLFWLSRIHAWGPTCISFSIGAAVGLMLLVFSIGNYYRRRHFWFG